MIGSLRILVVDDDPASCEFVAYSLKPLGYPVAIAHDGDRALNMGMEEDIGLVILDVHMPMRDGVEILARLRERPARAQLKVLALTGDDSDEVRAAMATKGVDGFLTKPVDLAALRAEVTRLMAGQLSGDLRLYRRLLDRQRRQRHTQGTHI